MHRRSLLLRSRKWQVVFQGISLCLQVRKMSSFSVPSPASKARKACSRKDFQNIFKGSGNRGNSRQCLPLCHEEYTTFTDTVASLTKQYVEKQYKKFDDLNPGQPRYTFNYKLVSLKTSIQKFTYSRNEWSSIKMFYGTFQYSETVLSKGSSMGIICKSSVHHCLEIHSQSHFDNYFS